MPSLRPLAWSEAKDFFGYAWRAQITNLSSLAILQTDAVFVAALLPINELGYLAIASQVANAARSIPLFALPPLVSRLPRHLGSAALKGPYISPMMRIGDGPHRL